MTNSTEKQESNQVTELGASSAPEIPTLDTCMATIATGFQECAAIFAELQKIFVLITTTLAALAELLVELASEESSAEPVTER